MLLAHMSRAYRIGRYPSSVRRRPSSSTISNDISSEAVWPKLLIFGIKHPQEGGGDQKNFFFVQIG